MIYVGLDVPMQRWPFANWALIAFTVVTTFVGWADQAGDFAAARRLAVELGRESSPAKARDQVAELDAKINQLLRPRFAGALDPAAFRPTQLVTHAFVHGNILHLLGNMLFLFAFGNAINAKLGHLQFLGLYLLIAVVSGLGWLLLGNGRPMVGASGAIMGLAGMLLVLYPLNELAIHTPNSYLSGGDAWRMPAWVFVAAYMALDLFGTLHRGAGIAYATHLAGEVTGFALALTLVCVGWITSDRGERNLAEIWGWTGDEADEPRARPPRRPTKPRPRAEL
jgi:membrane associated rhomboid family serine protease